VSTRADSHADFINAGIVDQKPYQLHLDPNCFLYRLYDQRKLDGARRTDHSVKQLYSFFEFSVPRATHKNTLPDDRYTYYISGKGTVYLIRSEELHTLTLTKPPKSRGVLCAGHVDVKDGKINQIDHLYNIYPEKNLYYSCVYLFNKGYIESCCDVISQEHGQNLQQYLTESPCRQEYTQLQQRALRAMIKREAAHDQPTVTAQLGQVIENLKSMWRKP
jgi:hypothetical protein